MPSGATSDAAFWRTQGPGEWGCWAALVTFCRVCAAGLLACVASVSNEVIARKLEREEKNSLPLSRHSFFFCSRPCNLFDELARKRLPHRLLASQKRDPLQSIVWPIIDPVNFGQM